MDVVVCAAKFLIYVPEGWRPLVPRRSICSAPKVVIRFRLKMAMLARQWLPLHPRANVRASSRRASTRASTGLDGQGHTRTAPALCSPKYRKPKNFCLRTGMCACVLRLCRRALATPSIGSTLAQCDHFGIPSTSHWTDAVITVQCPRTKTCTVTRPRTSGAPMPSSSVG